MRNIVIKLMMFMVILSILPLVSAVPPVQTTVSDAGLQIAYPQYQYITQDDAFTLYIHVYNTTQYITGATASCYLDLYNSTGDEIIGNQMVESGSDYYLAIDSGNFTDTGQHSFIIQCNTTGQAGFANGVFEVSLSGMEMTTGRAVVNVGILLVLIFVSSFFLLFAKNTESAGIKLFFNVLSYILMMLVVGGSYILIQAIRTNLTPIVNIALYVTGIILVVIMFYIMINITKHALQLMNLKKGFGSEYDDSTLF